MRGGLALSIALALACGATAAAHHSFQTEFDAKQPVTLRGVVTRIEWTNPHAWIHLQVESREGPPVEWAVQAAGPEALVRRGWRPDSVAPGMAVAVDGFRAKSGLPVANGRDITLPDGRQICANIPCRCCHR